MMDVGLGDEDRVPERADVGEPLDDRGHDDRREALGRLVQQQQFRAERQRARDRHHLAFAAGERVAAARAVALELGEHAVNPLDPRLGLPRLRMRPGWQRDIFRDRELAEYFALLRRKADPKPRDPVWAQPDEIRTLETDDRAGCRFAKTHDGAQARGLARAVAADQIDQLARLDLEGDATQHAAALDVHGQIFDP